MIPVHKPANNYFIFKNIADSKMAKYYQYATPPVHSFSLSSTVIFKFQKPVSHPCMDKEKSPNTMYTDRVQTLPTQCNVNGETQTKSPSSGSMHAPQAAATPVPRPQTDCYRQAPTQDKTDTKPAWPGWFHYGAVSAVCLDNIWLLILRNHRLWLW